MGVVRAALAGSCEGLMLHSVAMHDFAAYCALTLSDCTNSIVIGDDHGGVEQAGAKLLVGKIHVRQRHCITGGINCSFLIIL
ncbi:hypothetical protein BT93_K0978 [Corymbia citriodora subsp. variegata]|nr:hypothetical protein BT93_K0978 [Corymbia citriodora subsp. variegata]